LPVVFVFLKIDFSRFEDFTSLKSLCRSRGVLFKVMMYCNPALLAASTPNGEFSTTITSEEGRFILFNAISKGAGLGFAFSRSSPVIMTSKYFAPIFLSKIA
jgi:hypothetical protein